MPVFFRNCRKFLPVLYGTLFLIGLSGYNTITAQSCPGYVSTRLVKVDANVTSTTETYMEYKPLGYDDPANATKKYPLILYFGGTGEMYLNQGDPGPGSQQLCNATRYSLPGFLNLDNWPSIVTYSGVEYRYLIIMPFLKVVNGVPTSEYLMDVAGVLDYMLAHYRVDLSRIYLTGMSRGTDQFMNYVTGSLTAAKKIAAVASIANCFPDQRGLGQTDFDNRIGNLANAGVHYWGISCPGDEVCTETYSQQWASSLSALKPGYGFFSYAVDGCGSTYPTNHFAWEGAYKPGYQYYPTGTYDPVNNLNVGQWMIQYSQQLLVPVKLKNYTARLDKGKVFIEWTTTSEQNTDQFIIQRATPAGDFKDIATVKAAGYSNTEKRYVVTDDQPLPGTSLYRLVLKNYDQKKENFEIKKIINIGRWAEKVIIPNPVHDGSLAIYLNVEKREQVSIQLYDMSGRLLKQTNRQFMPGVTETKMDVSVLQKGTYLVRISGENTSAVKKVAVE